MLLNFKYLNTFLKLIKDSVRKDSIQILILEMELFLLLPFKNLIFLILNKFTSEYKFNIYLESYRFFFHDF